MAGVSPRTSYLAGNPTASWQPDTVRLAVILELQNVPDDDNPDALPCYAFRLIKERDPIPPGPDGDMSQAITYDLELAEGDFATIDPETTEPTGQLAPLYELNGNTNVPADSIVEITPSQGGRHFTFTYNSEDVFPATLTRKRSSSGTSIGAGSGWKYAYTRDTFDADEVQTQGIVESGTLKTSIDVERTQTFDGFFPDIITITVIGSTGSTYTLTESGIGTPTVDIAWNASDGTINALLTFFTCVTNVATVMGVTTYTHVFTSNDPTTENTIDIDGSKLEPEDAHYPAVFRNPNTSQAVPVPVMLRRAGGGDPQVTSKTVTPAKSPSQHMVLHLDVKNIRDGKYKLRFTSDDAWQELNWDADDSNIQTALSMLLACTVVEDGDSVTGWLKFTVTITADYDSHRLLTSKSTSIGTKYYVVLWSNGTLCTGPFGGVDPTAIPSYQGKAVISTDVAVVSIGDSVSVAQVWDITIRDAGDPSKVGAIVLDFGLGTQTSFPLACVTGALLQPFDIWVGTTPVTGSLTFTESNGVTTSTGIGQGSRFSKFRLTITSDFDPHTIDIFTAPLTGAAISQFLMHDETNCARWRGQT